MAKKKDVEEEPDVTCPVCGKPVGLDVASCPYCGAEFEEDEEVVEEAATGAVSEDESAECPVCGKLVSLAVSSCPNCGAEFEEEEVEEVIEVEEKQVPVKAKPAVVKQEVVEEAAEEEVVEEAVEVEEATEEVVETDAPMSITDLRVIGIALVILGIIGSQVAFMIDWYWTWVPPIEDNLGLFVTLPLIVVVVGLLVFLLVKKAVASGKSVPLQMPGASLSLFLFGVLALVMMLLYRPINNALQDSSGVVGGAFVVLLVAGVLVVLMGNRTAAKSSA